MTPLDGAATRSRLSRAVLAIGGALVLAALGGCTVTALGSGTSALTTVTPARLCPETGTARPDAAALTDCISANVAEYWTAQLGQPVQERVVAAPEPSTVAQDCRYFLSFGTAFYCPPDATVYITGAALDRDALAFGDELPYAIAGIVAHEYGHVVQDIVDQPLPEGQSSEAQSRTIEQQADCLGGVWARHATRLGLVNPVALRAAFEQELTLIYSLPVPPDAGFEGYDETATHGTVAERMAAFDKGVAAGAGRACDLVGLDGD